MKKTDHQASQPKRRPRPIRWKASAAPDFELPDANGHAVKLRDLTGKGNVVLYFYPKDMTPGCTRKHATFATT